MRLILMLTLLVCCGIAACSKAQNNASRTPTADDTSERATTTADGAAKVTIADDAPATSAEPMRITGLFRIDDGRLELRPCDEPTATYWVLGDTDQLNTLYADATAQGYAGQYVVVEVTGKLRKAAKPRGAAMASPYTAQFEVTSVERVRPKNPKNHCLGYDFWATGNEPFWSLSISEAEGLIELTQLGAPTLAFDYVKPTYEQDGTVIRYYSRGTEQRLKVMLTKEECYDSMSGNKFGYAVEVEVVGRDLVGCGREG